jgi:antitoxin CptB
MTQTLLTDPRRKRILYRATHRGTKESDAIVGGFFTEVVAGLPDDKLDEADALLDELDLDLLDWIMGRQPVPERWRNSLFDGVLQYYRTLGTR